METKKRICTKCKEEFITEVDSNGCSINTRCKECKSKQKNTSTNKKGIYHINL